MDFGVQRVATDGRSRVLINPTALIGASEIDKIAKFLLPLQCEKKSLKVPSNDGSSPATRAH